MILVDGHGMEFHAEKCPGHDGHARLVISTPSGTHVLTWCAEAEDLALIPREAAEAAGIPAPVVLKRPEADPGTWAQCGPVRMGLGGDGEVHVAIGNSQSSASPSDIRHIAALLCAHADAAETGPDPAEVDSLADALHAARCDDGDGCPLGATVDDRKTAVAALRWMGQQEVRDA